MRGISDDEITVMALALRIALEAFPTICLESLERGDDEAIHTVCAFARIALKERRMAEAASEN